MTAGPRTDAPCEAGASGAAAGPTPGAPPWQRWFWPCLLAVLLLDQATKSWLFSLPVERPFTASSPGPIAGFPGWVDRSFNPGVAWGVGGSRPGAVALLTAGLVPLLTWIWWRHFRQLGRWENLAFGAILGGALGNGIDRAMAQFGALRGVRDFIMVDLHPLGIAYVWPTFNIADAGISTGFAVLALLAVMKPKPVSPAHGARAVV
jgi:signal peptidase II